MAHPIDNQSIESIQKKSDILNNVNEKYIQMKRILLLQSPKMNEIAYEVSNDRNVQMLDHKSCMNMV